MLWTHNAITFMYIRLPPAEEILLLLNDDDDDDDAWAHSCFNEEAKIFPCQRALLCSSHSGLIRTLISTVFSAYILYFMCV